MILASNYLIGVFYRKEARSGFDAYRGNLGSVSTNNTRAKI